MSKKLPVVCVGVCSTVGTSAMVVKGICPVKTTRCKVTLVYKNNLRVHQNLNPSFRAGILKSFIATDLKELKSGQRKSIS